MTWLHRIVSPRLNRFLETRFGQGVAKWAEEIIWLLEYEPTWFPEFGFAVGAIGWGLFAMITDEMIVAGGAWILPCLAILGGITRAYVLLHLWYSARVLFTVAGAVLWAWVWWGLAGRYGTIPMMGVLLGVFVVELLTAAKFSIPCARDLYAEYQGYRDRT